MGRGLAPLAEAPSRPGGIALRGGRTALAGRGGRTRHGGVCVADAVHVITARDGTSRANGRTQQCGRQRAAGNWGYPNLVTLTL